MTVAIAVAVVGAGSLMLRLLPLVGATLIPDRMTVHAARAAMAVLAAMTVRTVLRHHDDALAGSLVTAPVLAALAVVTVIVKSLVEWRFKAELEAGRNTPAE